MKKVLLTLALAILIPGMVSAAHMGIYFDTPGSRSYCPPVMTYFNMYLYLHEAPYFITAVEYQLQTPDDPTHALLWTVGDIVYPDNVSVTLGGPFSGHSISYWPPMNGMVPGYNLMCTITGVLTAAVSEYDLVISPHPDGDGYVVGTYYPDGEEFVIDGLLSILCTETPNEEHSWGAIKSLYQ